MKSKLKRLSIPLLFVMATLLVDLYIVDLFYYKINEYYQQQTVQKAIDLSRQVTEIVISKNFDIGLLHKKGSRNPVRHTLQQLTKKESKILNILIIDESKTILVCTEPDAEDKTYKNPSQLELLDTREPRVFRSTTGDSIEQLDVIHPIEVDHQLEGYLRTVITNDELHRFYRTRLLLLWGVGLIFPAIAGLLFLISRKIIRSRIPLANRGRLQNKEEKTVLSDRDTDSHPPEEKEISTVFSSLNKLYQDTDDLNASFKQSEEKIHSMMRVLNQGLLILDPEMKIITYNEYLIDVFGIRSTSNAARKVHQVLEKNPRVAEMFRRAKNPLIHEVKQRFLLHLLNGRKIHVEVIARPITNTEAVAGVIFYIKNTEVLTKLEKSLQRSMKYGVISQLASSIGHEIRNPLSSLAIHTEIVDSMVTKSIEDATKLNKIKRSIGILNTEVERLHKLIDQFFTLAKSQEIELTFENVNELMEEVIELVQQQAFEKNVTISKDLAGDLPLVKLSKDQLKQVVINLVLNSYDAMPEGGDLYLATRFRDGKVVIAIKDTGHGIPENTRDNIFDLYFTTKDTGGGIGLAISRKIVEAHEGELYFETKTGVGTTFYIELPTSLN